MLTRTEQPRTTATIDNTTAQGKAGYRARGRGGIRIGYCLYYIARPFFYRRLLIPTKW